MTAVGLGQQGSEATGPGSSLCRVKYLYDFTFVGISIPMVSMAQRVGQQGCEELATGSNPSLYLHF